MKKLTYIIVLLLVTFSLYGQHRTIRGDLTVKGRLIELPYGTINMADYYRSDVNWNAWNYRNGASDITFSSDYNNYLSLKIDSINNQADYTKYTYLDGNYFVVNSPENRVSTSFAGWWYQMKFNDIKSPTTNAIPFHISGRLETSEYDTIDIREINGLNISISTKTAANSIADLQHMRVLELHSSYDDYLVVDSAISILIGMDDNGIDPDSIGAVYGIYNKDWDLRGADKTYFLYSEYGDNYLNGDVEARDYKFIYDDEITMSDYIRPIGVDALRFQSNTSDYILSGSYNFGKLWMDTINILSGNTSTFAVNYNNTLMNSEAVAPTAIYRGQYHYLEHQNINILETNGVVFGLRLEPSVDDTIVAERFYPMTITGEKFTPEASSRVDIEEERILQLFGSYGSEVAIDSTMALFIGLRDDGIDPDSIGAVYGIYNDDDGLRGADKTYFLYSEFGDNYLNGDLEVTGLIKNTPPHAAMSFEDETEALSMDQNVWEKLTNATDDLFATIDNEGFTQAGDSITIVTPGSYMINASVSFSGTTNSDVYEFAVFKNEVLASPKIERTTTSTDIGNVSLPIYLDGLVADDDISLRIRNTSNNFDATLVSCSWITWLLYAD